MMRAIFGLVLMLLLGQTSFVWGWQENRAPALPVAAAELSGELQEVPLSFAGTQILVDDVYVNGKGPFRFLLDTGGMGGGRVDKSLVEKLGLKQSGEMRAGDGTSGKATTLPVYELESLKIGNLSWKGVRTLSRDYNAQGGLEVRGHIDGILGFALFENFLATIDYGKRKILVEKGSLPEANGEDVLAMEHDGIPGIEIELGGKKQLARLDTGSMGGIMISEEISKSLKFAATPEVVGQARTLSGVFSIRSAPLKGTVRLGKHVLENPNVTIGGPVLGVNLGGMVLRDFVITYDQKNQRVRVLKNSIARPRGVAKSTRLGPAPVSVPMKVERGRPIIEAKVHGKGPFKFVLDTGAGVVALDLELAKKLELKPKGKTRVGDPASPQAVEADAYDLESVEVGAARFGGVNAIALEGMSATGADGVIGTAMFFDALIALDFANESLTISRGALGRDENPTPFRFGGGSIMTLPIRVGGLKIDSHIDTGNPGVFSIPLAKSKEVEWLTPPSVKGRARTVGGDFEIHEGVAKDTLVFAGREIKTPTIRLNDRFSWGNLGTGALLQSKLMIDQVNERLSITPSAADPAKKASTGPTGRPRIGVAFGFTPERVQIAEVIAGSLAEKAGLKAGDVVRTINGEAITPQSQERIGDLLKALPVTIAVDREGKRVELKIE